MIRGLDRALGTTIPREFPWMRTPDILNPISAEHFTKEIEEDFGVKWADFLPEGDMPDAGWEKLKSALDMIHGWLKPNTE
jgi:hypothetical protein